MLNRMCKDCARLGSDCKGTQEQVWTGCVYYKKDVKRSLEVQKAEALSEYKKAKYAYFENQNDKNWRFFCDKKRVCMLLGVRI